MGPRVIVPMSYLVTFLLGFSIGTICILFAWWRYEIGPEIDAYNRKLEDEFLSTAVGVSTDANERQPEGTNSKTIARAEVLPPANETHGTTATPRPRVDAAG